MSGIASKNLRNARHREKRRERREPLELRLPSASLPGLLTADNVRYVVVTYPREISQIDPLVREVPGVGDWTTVGPKRDGEIGEKTPVTGTTSLPVGSLIPVELYGVDWREPPKQPAVPEYATQALVEEGGTWSARLDTAGLPMGRHTIVAAGTPYLTDPTLPSHFR